MQLEIALTGTLMGLAFAAPPGAVTAETFRRGVRGGFPLAFGVQLGSLIGDATYALLAFAGLAALAQNVAFQVGLGVLGVVFLIYLALVSFQGAVAPSITTLDTETATERRGAFLSGMLLSLSNPWAIAFWLSLGGVITSFGLGQASTRDILVFFAFFMIGSALWAIVLALAISRLRRWIRPILFRLVSVACGLTLGSFGVAAAIRLFSSLVSSQ